MKKLNKLIICDLDGTLVDSLTDIQYAANMVRSHYGHPSVTRQAVRAWIGNGVRVLVEHLMAGTGIKGHDALPVFRDAYEQHMLDTTRPFSGMPEALDGLITQGYRIGVLSNKGEQACRQVLKGIPELNRYLDFIYGGDSFSQRKPSPVPVEAILHKMEIPKERAVVVGDSPNDIMAGKHAGTATIGVLYGYTDAQKIRACGPDAIIERADALPERIQHVFQGTRCR